MLQKMIEKDIAFYEEALANPTGLKAKLLKEQYGRSWKKAAKEEILMLRSFLIVQSGAKNLAEQDQELK